MLKMDFDVYRGEWKIFTGNELGCLLAWWMWYRAEKSGVDPAKAVMIASTVSSKILESMSKVEGFVFEETLTGFKWMANRSLELKKQGYHILFAFEGLFKCNDSPFELLIHYSIPCILHLR